MTFFFTLLLSVLITIALIPFFRGLAFRLRMVDKPGERKIHRNPIPRTGGIAMAIGAFIPIIFWNHDDSFVWAWLASAGIIVFFGIVDDSRGLSPKWKFLGQFAATFVIIYFGGIKIHTLGTLVPDNYQLPGWVAVTLTALVIVGGTNAINLSDGLDGLAGGICLLIFCCIGYLAWLEEDFSIGLLALALAGAIYGFLRFNTHPATVFMGDAGSQLLGFSAVTLSLSLTQGHTALSPVLPLLLVGFPILDTATVMVVRVVHGRSPFSADKSHLHHNLIALGLQQGESVVVIYACQTILVLSAFMLRFHSDWALLGGYIAFCITIVVFFAAANRRGWKVRPAAAGLRDYFGSVTLRRMKEDGVSIRYAFLALEYGFLLLLVVIGILPAKAPSYVSSAALVFLVLLLVVWTFKRDRLGDVLRITLYLMIPVAVFQAASDANGWMKGAASHLFNAAFVLLVLLDVAVSKLTKRKEGFRSTPLDFLILAIAVVVPNLPDQNLQAYNLGLIAAKTIILYFSFEVLMADLRGRFGGLALATGIALAAFSVKGLF